MNTTDPANTTDGAAVAAPVDQPVRPVAWLCSYRSGEEFVSLAANPMNDQDVMSATPLVMRSTLDAAVAAERERCAELETALETLVNRCNADFVLAADEAVIAAEAALERLYRARKA